MYLWGQEVGKGGTLLEGLIRGQAGAPAWPLLTDRFGAALHFKDQGWLPWPLRQCSVTLAPSQPFWPPLPLMAPGLA